MAARPRIPLAAGFAVLALCPGLAGAQQGPIVTDGSLGPAGDVPFDEAPGGDRTYQITDDLGKFSGNRKSLFHSFARFDVPEGDTANFSSSETPARVIARVTGNDRSEVEGTIRSSIPGADLFLLNPFGVIFGRNASVDVTGSFYASSADAVRFEGGGEPDFSTGDATPDPLLSSAEPRAFGFLVDTPAPIVLEGTQLSVRDGQTLMLAGGDIDITGRAGIQVPSLGASGGEVAIASVGSSLEVPLAASQLDALALAPDALGDVTLSSEAVLDASSRFGGASGSGRVVIRGGRVVLDRTSITAQASNDVDGASTAVDIGASERITLQAGTAIQGFAVSSAPVGDITLAAPEVELTGAGTTVASFAASSAGGPDVRVAGGTLSLNAGAMITSANLAPVAAPGGSIQVATENVRLDTGSEIRSDTAAAGPGGAIQLASSGDVTLAGGAKLVSATASSGAGGDIEIDAGGLGVDSGSLIASENRSDGAGGNVDLAVTGTLRIAGGGEISTRAEQNALGTGGALDVTAGHLTIETGPAASPSQLAALTFSTLGAPGGALTLAAGNVTLEDGGQIRTTTGLPEGRAPGGTPVSGAAGDLSVDVADAFLAQGVSDAGDPSGVFARSADSSIGAGGNLTIAARSLELAGGAEISARTIGAGNAGALAIQVAERLRVSGGSNLLSSISARGDVGRGGDAAIEADVVELANGGVISASTIGTGDSGNLTLRAREVLVSGANIAGESGIFAQTLSGLSTAGDAGDVLVEASDLVRIEDGGRISVASLAGGLAGDVDISGGGRVEVAGGEISARVTDTADTSGAASDVRIRDASAVALSDGARVTAETSGTGVGGVIEIAAVDVSLSSGAEVTARSTSPTASAGDAGSIRIDAERRFTSHKSALTTTATNAGGGQIAINAGDRLELVRSLVETTVSGDDASADAGNIDLPFRSLPDSPIPRAVLLSESTIRANAVAANAGNIAISADLVLRSAGSIVQASSDLGVDGDIDVPEPNREIVGQLAVLPANYVDVSSLLTTPCEARTERAGSFVIEQRRGTNLRADAPLSAELLLDAPAGSPVDPHCGSMEEDR